MLVVWVLTDCVVPPPVAWFPSGFTFSLLISWMALLTAWMSIGVGAGRLSRPSSALAALIALQRWWLWFGMGNEHRCQGIASILSPCSGSVSSGANRHSLWTWAGRFPLRSRLHASCMRFCRDAGVAGFDRIACNVGSSRYCRAWVVCPARRDLRWQGLSSSFLLLPVWGPFPCGIDKMHNYPCRWVIGLWSISAPKVSPSAPHVHTHREEGARTAGRGEARGRERSTTRHGGVRGHWSIRGSTTDFT